VKPEDDGRKCFYFLLNVRKSQTKKKTYLKCGVRQCQNRKFTVEQLNASRKPDPVSSAKALIKAISSLK
jgi:hypothetical protein